MSTNDQTQLMQTIIEQQKDYIQMQETRMEEKDATIAELRKLVDELQSLKANLEETLNEFRRQFFGTSSEKTTANTQKNVPSSSEIPGEVPQKIEVKSHTRERKPKSRREDLYAKLPVREVLIPLTDEQRYCDYCRAKQWPTGTFPVRKHTFTPFMNGCINCF